MASRTQNGGPRPGLWSVRDSLGRVANLLAPTASRKAAVQTPRSRPAKLEEPLAEQEGATPSSSSNAGAGEQRRKAAARASWKEAGEIAWKLWDVYHRDCAPPDWSLSMLEAGELEACAKTAVVYHRWEDHLEVVQRVAKDREPVNMVMSRRYDQDRLERLLGYRVGAYAQSSRTLLMPNLAFYSKTPMKSSAGDMVHIHVISAVGYALDSPEQPDSQYFLPTSEPGKWKELVERTKQLWMFVFECAKRHHLRYVYLSDAAGSELCRGLVEQGSREHSYERLKQESLEPVLSRYRDSVELAPLADFPAWPFSQEGRRLAEDSLLVNTCGPWSFVGNGHASDDSLDGLFGRSTALSLLCSPWTNPRLRYEGVDSVDGSLIRGRACAKEKMMSYSRTLEMSMGQEQSMPSQQTQRRSLPLQTLTQPSLLLGILEQRQTKHETQWMRPAGGQTSCCWPLASGSCFIGLLPKLGWFHWGDTAAGGGATGDELLRPRSRSAMNDELDASARMLASGSYCFAEHSGSLMAEDGEMSWSTSYQRSRTKALQFHCQNSNSPSTPSGSTLSFARQKARQHSAQQVSRFMDSVLEAEDRSEPPQPIVDDRERSYQKVPTGSDDVTSLPSFKATMPHGVNCEHFPPGGGPPLDEILRPGDVVKVVWPNLYDHVMLVILRPQVVGVIQAAAPVRRPSVTSTDVNLGGAEKQEKRTIAIDIFEVQFFESSSDMEFFERRTYWVVCNPFDGHLAMIDPNNPVDTSEWERLDALSSPFDIGDQGEWPSTPSAQRVDQVYEAEAAFMHDVVLDPPLLSFPKAYDAGGSSSSSSCCAGLVCSVRPGGAADAAGIKPGDRLSATRRSGESIQVAFHRDVRRVRLDWKAFHMAIWEVEQQKLQWSLRTAARAVMQGSHIDKDKYTGAVGRTRLAAELRDIWERDPICTTVPIRVWQRYIFSIWDNDDVSAAEEVLRVMPCRGDRTLPSELWRILKETKLWSEVCLGKCDGDSESSRVWGRNSTQQHVTALESRGMQVFYTDEQLRAARSCHCAVL